MPEPRQLLGPDGKPVSAPDLPDHAAIVAHTATVPVLPAMVHGFTVTAALGPYPIDAEDSHRRAMYVELRPVSPIARRLCEAKNAAAVLAHTPLMPEAAAEIERDPGGRLAEVTTMDTLREAVRKLRRYMEIPRQEFELRRN